jgi:hypothetical protein
VGVELGGQLLQVLLYANDIVLVSHNPAGLQKLLNVLGAFCDENCVTVNVPKTEIVVFGQSKWKPPPGHSWRDGDQPIPVSDHFKYRGVELHSTKGLGPAVERLRAAGLRATWAINQLGISDFSTRCRLYRILTQPVLNYCSEVWSPHEMRDLHSALHARLRVLQNDYLRQLGCLRGRVPALILARESLSC